ncbi:hypothetical protein GQ53DRAFT_826549 [Thozetella sp. PMI_491]|nr:hypothetical protein GQ53DRAFT_826549 [Thozetella sp. PMI_491]
MDDEKKMIAARNNRRSALRFLGISSCTIAFVAIMWLLHASPAPDGGPQAGHFSEYNLPLDANSGLGVIRVLQGILTLLSYNSATGSLELLQWCLVSREQGRRYSTFLVLSPATGLLAILRILVSRSTILVDRLWALLKALLLSSIYISAFVLFFKTSKVSSYQDEPDKPIYNVTAGVGLFNGSYLSSFFRNLDSAAPASYPYKTLQYSYQAMVYDLVVNPMYSTTAASVALDRPNVTFQSYLLSGGAVMANPKLPPSNPAYSLLKIEQVQSIQLNFESAGDHTFAISDCSTFANSSALIGIKLCVEKSNEVGSLIAGLYICNWNATDNQCNEPSPREYMTTWLTPFTRQATIVAATSNMSIIGVSDLTTPASYGSIDLVAYRKTLEWLLDFTATNIPAPSSIANHFWNGGDKLVSSPLDATDLWLNFQGLLAFPFWLFNANGHGNVELSTQLSNGTLPPQFHTSATLVGAFEQIYFDEDMATLFGVTQGFVLLFVWAVLLWAWLSGAQRLIPTISSFAAFDLAVKAYTNMRFSKKEAFCAKDQDIIDAAKSARIAVYELHDIYEIPGQEALTEIHEVYGSHKRIPVTSVQELQG